MDKQSLLADITSMVSMRVTGNMRIFLFLGLVIFGVFGKTPWALAETLPPLERIDLENTLIGHEATFQDREMLRAEKPEVHFTRRKFYAMAEFIAIIQASSKDILLLDETNLRRSYKPFVTIFRETSPLLTLMMEPNCLECTMGPVRLRRVASHWAPAFEIAKRGGLKPSVYPLYGGGGGHLHIGGMKVSENPFLKFPYLLRNTLVYFHQHPSLLYGFGEANDVGPESSARSLHEVKLSRAFEEFIERYDHYLTSHVESSKYFMETVKTFFTMLRDYPDLYVVLTEHNAFINLHHLERALYEKTDKITVEFRGFRAFQTEEHVFEAAKMLLQIMDKLSAPGLLVPLKHYSPQQSLNTLSTLVITEDWRQVKNEMGIDSPLLDEMVTEFTDNDVFVWEEHPDGSRTRETYSEFERRGNNEEVVIPLPGGLKNVRSITYEGLAHRAERIQIDGKTHLVTVVKKEAFSHLPPKLHPCLTLLGRP